MLAALVAAFSFPASAQQQCGPRDALVDALRDQYGETRVVSAFTSNGQLFEMYANESGDSWSGVMVGPDGMACMVVVGKDFEIHTPAKPMSAPL
jgi:hypothetical protein